MIRAHDRLSYTLLERECDMELCQHDLGLSPAAYLAPRAAEIPADAGVGLCLRAVSSPVSTLDHHRRREWQKAREVRLPPQ
jgi:hypothetical protein